MKTLAFIYYIFSLTGLVIAQDCKPFNTFNKEAELKKFVECGGNVEEMSPNIYKLTYQDGISKTFNLNNKENTEVNNSVIDTTIINIWAIDTTKFNNMFTYWQTVRVRNTPLSPVIIEDVNKNSLPELYGYSDRRVGGPLPWVGPVKIYEQNLVGIYQNVFTFDSLTMYVQSMGNIHRTDYKELVLSSLLANNGVVVYKSDSLGALPTTFDFIFYYQPNQINNMFFGDYDNNKITDCAFIDAANPSKIIICEFRDSINNFNTVYQQVTEGDSPSGFAIGDFDLDGKTELISSTGAGNIYVIENVDVNQYSIVNQFTFPSYNAYMQTTTNDIDGNGKPEFWIGGQSFPDGITMYQCYELDDNGWYSPVARIELRYSLSITTNYIQAVDINDDGVEEIVISSGNIILILKFAGSPGEHRYDLWYAKLGEATQPGAEIYPVAIADLDGDSRKDLLIPFNKYEEPYILAFSYILRADTVTGIIPEMEKSIQEINITSHPNPFNLTSTINIQINKTSDAQIKIFNFLGEEIDILLDRELSPGNHNIYWDAKDKSGNSLPSGIYLIVFKTKDVVKAVKSILIK